MTRVNRVEHLDASALKPPVRMDNGFLKVEGRIARVGIQEYTRADGTIHRELRVPEEVFHPDSLASFQQVPVTNRHPPGMLTAKNAKQFTVGNVGESVRRDGDYVAAPLMITDAEAIAAIEQGRSQLSNGYSCELDETQDPALVAKWGAYDSIQRNIRGNHCALVDVARAGPGASLRLDDNDAVTGVLVCDSKPPVGSQITGDRMPLKMKLDGFEIEVADGNAQAAIERVISAHKERADSAEKSLADKEKSLSALQAKLDVATAKQKEAEDKSAASDATLEARADALSNLKAKAKEILGSNAKLDGGELAVMKLVIAKVLPKIKLDGKDESYVRASYDSAIAGLPEAPTALDNVRTLQDPKRNDEGAPSSTPQEAKARYDARMRAQFVK